jgi:cell division protein FtsB
MIATDLIAVVIAIVSPLIVMGLTIKKNAQLEKENAWLRERVTNLRKQVSNMVERPF